MFLPDKNLKPLQTWSWLAQILRIISLLKTLIWIRFWFLRDARQTLCFTYLFQDKLWKKYRKDKSITKFSMIRKIFTWDKNKVFQSSSNSSCFNASRRHFQRHLSSLLLTSSFSSINSLLHKVIPHISRTKLLSLYNSVNKAFSKRY